MKKTLIITLIVAAVIGGAAFAYVKTDMHIAFIDNYIKNFSDNLFELQLRYEAKKAEKEEENSETDDTADISDENSPESADDDNGDTVQSDEVSLNDTQTETKNSEPNIAVSGKHDITERNSIKITKTQKKDENGEPIDVLTKKLVQTCDPIALNNASSASYSHFSNGILCVCEKLITLYDKNGKEKWKETTPISSPVVKIGDPYILIWENGSNKAVVYENNKLLHTIETADKIITGYMAESGEFVLITAKPYYKGEVKVYNKSGEEIFARSFGSDSVISAALSKSRKLAVSLMSSDSGVNTKISFFDINKTNEEANIIYQNTIVYDLEFYGNSLIGYADDKMISLKTNAKENWVYPYKDKTLDHCMKDSKDTRLLIFDTQNTGELSVVSLSGKETQKIITDIIPGYGDIYGGYLIYNSERNLFLSRMDGTLLAKYSASRDIHKSYFIDSDNILVVYNSSIEFLHTEKGE